MITTLERRDVSAPEVQKYVGTDPRAPNFVDSVREVPSRIGAFDREARIKIDAIDRAVRNRQSADGFDLALDRGLPLTIAVASIPVIAGTAMAATTVATTTTTTTTNTTTIITAATPIPAVMANRVQVQVQVPTCSAMPTNSKDFVAAMPVAIPTIGPVENFPKRNGWKNSFVRIKGIAVDAASPVSPPRWAMEMEPGTKRHSSW